MVLENSRYAAGVIKETHKLLLDDDAGGGRAGILCLLVSCRPGRPEKIRGMFSFNIILC